jgi:putative ABC transport system permease protein
MTVWSRVRSCMRDIVGRAQMESEMDAELRFHMQAYAEDLKRQGVAHEEAMRRAQTEFGGMESAKEECREARGVNLLDSLIRDVHYALRSLRKDLSFTVVAVLTLGLGIGASTAIFSVVENVLVEPFPYPDANRMMTLEIHDAAPNQSGGRAEYSGPEFLDYVDKNHVFDRVIADASLEVLHDAGEGTERFHGVLTTPGTFEFFGMPALLGRVMEPEDYEPSAPPVFVLRYKTWVTNFAGDPRALNKAFVLNGVPRTLIGVMPPRFGWGNGDVFIFEKPSRADAARTGEFPPVWYLVGHLRPGVTERQAQADLTLVANQLAKVYPKSYPKHFRVELRSITDMVVGRFRATLYLTSVAVALLLLIACANVTNLVLARAATREKEFAVRAALGAGRGTLVRQMLVESLLLAVAGAVLGTALASVGLTSMVSLMPQETIPAETVIRLNAPVLLFALLTTFLTPILFGLVPALRAARKNLEKQLRTSGRSTCGGSQHGRFHDAMIVADVALSFTLLVGAGLLMRSFVALRGVDLGMRPDHVLLTRLPLPPEQYKSAAQVQSFYRPLLAHVKTLPGVTDVAESSALPPYGGFSSQIEIPGHTHSEKWNALFQLCSEDYFALLRIKLLQGRVFNAAEVNDARKLAVVNETFVRKYFPGVDPVGQHVQLSDLQHYPDRVADPSFEIVGVIGDVLNQGVPQPVDPEVWIPATVTGSGLRGILVRTSNDPMGLMNEVRREVWATNRSVALTFTGSLESLINMRSYAGPRFGFVVMSVFAGAGLMLVTIGVYSVIAYATARRKHEIGIRMALGAQVRDILQLVLVHGVRLALIGVAIGVPAALTLASLMQGELFGISASDPSTLIAVTVLLLFVGLLACYGPARGATRVDPLVALRYE